MELWFDEGGMTGDFCAVCNPPKDLPVTYDEWGEPSVDIWFRAYATVHDAKCGYGHDYDLWSEGYDYDCCCYVEVNTPSCFDGYELAHFPARNQEEAERLLQACADAIYEEDR